MGTVTIALLQLAADDPESEVWCLAVEETGYLLDDVLGFINVRTVIDVNSVWGASNCRNTKPIFVCHSVSEHLPGPEYSTLLTLSTESPGVHPHKESLQYHLCGCNMSVH